MNEKVWLSKPHMCGDELNYVRQAFTTNWISPLGPNVDEFEHDLEKFTRCNYAVALSSGTAAIHLALILLGVGPDDEVICQSFTFSATANPIVYLGATPIFVDSEPETWNMCPEMLEIAIIDRISKGKVPKAIIPVHLYGMPAKMDAILDISKKYNIPVIEDAAEALGSTINGKAMGTFGRLGVLSFNGNKIITTSGGGALLSNEKTIIDRARHLATQARDEAPHYEHTQIGYNYRLSNVCAGIGRGQMTVIEERVRQRRMVFDTYLTKLANLPGVSFLAEPVGFMSNRWLTTMVIDSCKNGVTDPYSLCLALLKENIESRLLWKPMHLQPVFKHYPSYLNDVSAKLFEQGLCLPSSSDLLEADIDRISTIIKTQFMAIKSSTHVGV